MRDYLDQLDAAAITIPKQQRLLAALGPKMTQLAADRAAGVHPFLVTPDHVAARRQLMGAGPLIAPHQAVVLERDPDLAREAARNGIGMFIGFPSYRANLQSLGFGEPDLVPGGSDRLIDAVVAWGGVDAVADRVRAHLDAGADHVALHVLPARRGLSVADAWHQLAQLNQTTAPAGAE
jgi:probable F420-dependent oxidoreductase